MNDRRARMVGTAAMAVYLARAHRSLLCSIRGSDGSGLTSGRP